MVDSLDNCPLHMNNGEFFYTPSVNGYIQNWLLLDPLYTIGFSTKSCLPVGGILFEDIEEDLEPTAEDNITLWDENISYWVPYSSGA